MPCLTFIVIVWISSSCAGRRRSCGTRRVLVRRCRWSGSSGRSERVGRGAGMVDVARLLLDAGVSPDTNNGARPHHGYRSALHGSVTSNNPGITRLLLERSANPNDGESLYQAAGHRDHECLRLLLNHGATVAGSWAVDVAVGGNDAEGVRLLLDAAKRQTPERVSELASDL